MLCRRAWRTLLPLVLVLITPLAKSNSVGRVTPENLIDEDHWKRARKLVEGRLHANPNDGHALYLLSKIKENFKDLNGATADAERSIELEPRSADAHGQLAECYALLADRSSVLKQLNYVRKMKRELDAALALDPKHLDTQLVDIVFTFRAPSVVGGDRKHARELADQLMKSDPAWGWLAHARLSEIEHDQPRAERSLLKAVAADPAHYKARVELAKYFCCSDAPQRLDLAEKHAEEALKIDPARTGAYNVLAAVYAIQQRWQDLDNLLAQSEKMVPDDFAPFYQAAKVLLAQGKDLPRAEKYVQKYLSQEPEGRQPTSSQGKWLLGVIYEHEGKKPDAVRELQAAIRMDPTSEPARRDLKRLSR